MSTHGPSFQPSRRAFLAAGAGGVFALGSLSAREGVGEIIRQDPRLDQIVPKNAHLEKLAEGFDWSEGPVWDRAAQRLLFSDIPKNMIWQWSVKGGLKSYLKPSGYTGATPRGGESGSNGLAFDIRGKLVLCQHGDRRVARLNDDGKTFTTLADNYRGKKLNSPNDLVFRKNGDLYFTDPPYGLEKGADDPKRELDFCGVYRLGTDGKVYLLTKDLTRPNGIAFSPDEKTLYVANSDPKQAIWMAYQLKSDGGLEEGKLFHDCTKMVGRHKGLPDGMKVDQQGFVYATGPGGVWIFTPGGDVLGRLDPGSATANCGFGENGSTLFLTADKILCRVVLTTRGLGF